MKTKIASMDRSGAKSADRTVRSKINVGSCANASENPADMCVVSSDVCVLSDVFGRLPSVCSVMPQDVSEDLCEGRVVDVCELVVVGDGYDVGIDEGVGLEARMGLAVGGGTVMDGLSDGAGLEAETGLVVDRWGSGLARTGLAVNGGNISGGDLPRCAGVYYSGSDTSADRRYRPYRGSDLAGLPYRGSDPASVEHSLCRIRGPRGAR
jgi:hypothetical protein